MQRRSHADDGFLLGRVIVGEHVHDPAERVEQLLQILGGTDFDQIQLVEFVGGVPGPLVAHLVEGLARLAALAGLHLEQK